jgi:type I restriction enzyme S subunit
VRLQNAIADFLDRKTAAIDALIAKKERLIELLEEKRQALITQAVTRGLDPNVPLKDSGIDWLGPIPAHWKAVRIKHVARLESGHTPNKETPEYWAPEGSDGVPWVSLNDTKALAASDYISETAYRITAAGIANSSARMLPARVVVFTRDATVGEAAITTVPATVSQHVIAWVCGTDVVPEYLLFAFYAMREELDRRTMGATVKTIGLNDVKALTIPLPNRAEQEAIVNRVRDAVARIRSARELVVAQLDRLREYRQALITAAVTGQIDVTADSP